MAAFQQTISEDEWPIWLLFRDGPVCLFHKQETLGEMIRYLQDRHYVVLEFDCQGSPEPERLLWEIGLRLGFSFGSSYGPDSPPNLDSFNDFMHDIHVPEQTGLILVLKHFHVFYRDASGYAHHILEILAHHHRRKLLHGLRFMALVQTDDPFIEIKSLDVFYAHWNHGEWSFADRTPTQPHEQLSIERMMLRPGGYLVGAQLTHEDLSETNLSGADLTGANMSDATLRHACLAGAKLDHTFLMWASLEGADLAAASLRNANAQEASFAGALLHGACLAGAMLSGANLSEAQLVDADLTGAYLAGVSFARANLQGACLDDATLDGADLRGARVDPAQLARARSREGLIL
jgi:uncharacterized protein YjbI with pentapeptide repeats